MSLSREQSIHLRVGQMVRTKCFPGRFYRISGVFVRRDGPRIIELENKIWVRPHEIEEGLAA